MRSCSLYCSFPPACTLLPLPGVHRLHRHTSLRLNLSLMLSQCDERLVPLLSRRLGVEGVTTLFLSSAYPTQTTRGGNGAGKPSAKRALGRRRPHHSAGDVRGAETGQTTLPPRAIISHSTSPRLARNATRRGRCATLCFRTHCEKQPAVCPENHVSFSLFPNRRLTQDISRFREVPDNQEARPSC